MVVMRRGVVTMWTDFSVELTLPPEVAVEAKHSAHVVELQPLVAAADCLKPVGWPHLPLHVQSLCQIS